MPTLPHRRLPDDVALEDTILVALRGWLPLDHDGLVGAAAGDDVLGGCRWWLLGQRHSEGHQVRMSTQPIRRHVSPHCRSPLCVLAELAPAHIVDSTQAELVGTGGHQSSHHHPRQLGVDAGQQHCPGCICGEKAVSRWRTQPSGFLHPLPAGSAVPRPSSSTHHLFPSQCDDRDQASAHISRWGQLSHHHRDNPRVWEVGTAPYCSQRSPRGNAAGGCCHRRAWPRSG